MKPVLILLAFLLAQLGPTQQAQPTGSIEGSIVKFGTTEGIPRARVTMNITQGSGTAQGAIADDQGKFVFRNLGPGQYRFSATRDGYVSAEYGQRGPSSSGVAITLNAQQQLKDVRIGMTPTGAISGRILNRYGEPVGNANVQALRYSYQEGRRVLNPVQTIRTNDLGEYRLFWMPPGQYIISAQPVEALSVDPGGTVLVQVGRGGGPGAGGQGPGGGGPGGLAGIFGAQLGIGGVTRITVTGDGGPGGPGGLGGPGGAPPPPPPPPPPAAAFSNAETSVPVYYPGTTDVAAATAVDLQAGGNVGGVNLTVVEVRPARIRGQVLNGGRPANGAQVSLYQRTITNGNLTVRGATANDMGAFEFRNVAPGEYEIAATLNAPGPIAIIAGTPLGNAAGLNAGGGRGGFFPGQPVLAARAAVDVVGADIDGLGLSMEPGFNVNGKAVIEGRLASDNNSPLAGLRVQLQSDPQIPPLAITPANPDADGSFTITGVSPGNYRLSVTGLPRNTYLKSARLSGVDILNGGLRIDSAGGPLDIVLGSTPGSLDATVVDDKQAPVPGVTVALVPSATQQKRFDLYRNATSDANGRIHLDGLVPGDYKIFAWEDIESGAWTDPDFMLAYENRATAVRVPDGGRATVDVKVIPYKVQ
jgi:hypothetical protein